jgi:hypothetical protein
MLADACNQSTLAGNSKSNLLLTHLTKADWYGFQSCAVEFCLALESADLKQEEMHFRRGAKKLGIASAYRPLHMYRLCGVVFKKSESVVDELFKVHVGMRAAFKSRLSPLLAAVASCQCQKVERSVENFRFLSAVAQDRTLFLQTAANVTDALQKKEIQNLIHFGPARFLKSTSRTGLLGRAFEKYRNTR